MAATAQQTWTFSTVVGAPTGADATDAVTNAPAKPPKQPWRSGLCGCFDYPLSCLSVCFCEPCVIGQTTSIAANGSRNLCLIVGGLLLLLGVLGFALQLVAQDGVTVAGMALSYVGGVLGLFLICYARAIIRQRKNLEGSGLGDFCISLCCSPCSICQMLNEYSPYRGPWAGYEVLDEEQAGGAAASKA